jgi:phage terminase large subunit-like protein
LKNSLGRTLADHDPAGGEQGGALQRLPGEVEAGYFLLPREGPWLTDFRSELRVFPHGKHDD